MAQPMTDLSADELRVKIAELKGWTDIQSFILVGIKGDVHRCGPIPNWTTSDADACQLLDEMIAKRIMITIHLFLDKQVTVICGYDGVQVFYVTAETRPLAICRAYLAARERWPELWGEHMPTIGEVTGLTP